MAEYNYKARDQAGILKTGEITATNEANAAELLAEHHLILVKLSPKGSSSLDLSKYLGVLTNRVSMKERVVFTRQLGTMIKSGLPIVQALHILAEQTKNSTFKNVIKEMATLIEGGTNFSATLGKYPRLFDRVYVNLVRSGEASGHLEEMLDRLATQQEKTYALSKKVRGALMYPAFVIVAMIGATILMLLMVIPPLKSIFVDAGAELPFATKLLVTASDFLRQFYYIVAGAAVGAIIGFRAFAKSDAGHDILDRVKLRLPIFGPLFQKIYVARLTRTLSSLVGGGVPILQALEIVAESTGNLVYERALKAAAKEVEAGVPLSQPLRTNPAFPVMVPQMVTVGEQTGNLDEVLTKLADFFDDEVDNIVKNLTTLMEPLLMVVMGAGVAGLLVAIMQPIYGLGNVIK